MQSYIKHAVNETEEQFNQLSLEERGKFDEETLVNVNSLRKRMMAVSTGSRFSNEFIVVSSMLYGPGTLFYIHPLQWNCQLWSPELQ